MTATVFLVLLVLAGIFLLFVRRQLKPLAVSEQEGSTAPLEPAEGTDDPFKPATRTRPAPSGPSPVRPILLLTAVAVFVVALLVGLGSTVTLVRATEVGVPVTFGRVGDPLSPGVHLTAPWTSVETYPTRPLTVEIDVTARTSQGGQVQVRVANRWAVEPEQARTLYFLARTDDEARISSDIVEKNLSQAVGVVYSRTTNIDAANDREKPPGLIQAELQKLLDPYGIRSDAVLLRSVEPDERTAAAIANFATQQQATRIATEANNTATEEAKRRVIEAQGLRNAAAQLPNLSSAQLQALCAQAWERMQNKAIEQNQTLYTTPCGDSTSVIAQQPSP